VGQPKLLICEHIDAFHPFRRQNAVNGKNREAGVEKLIHDLAFLGAERFPVGGGEMGERRRICRQQAVIEQEIIPEFLPEQVEFPRLGVGQSAERPGETGKGPAGNRR
jgi:hypothetical protein